MKKLLGFAICFGLVFALGMGQVGCKKKTKTPDKTKSPKTKTPPKKTPKADATLGATAPESQDVQIGGDAVVFKFTITRQKGYDGDVEVSVDTGDAKVTGKTDKIAKDSSDGSVSLTAAVGAKEGEGTATITLKADGKEAEVKFPFKVTPAEKKKVVPPDPKKKKVVPPDPKKKKTSSIILPRSYGIARIEASTRFVPVAIAIRR